MNASYEWLRAFVNFDLSPSELADLLTRRCATVDGVVGMRDDLKDIVIARVVEAGPHPDSDHLWVTKVDAGGELLDVVCGAPVVTKGTLYPFAPVGATLPGGLKIEKRKIRGETSNGMLCSARELQLGSDHAGIMALDIDAQPGAGFLDAMKVGDSRIVVDVLPNRPDLLSHRGLAREIAAALHKQVNDPKIPGTAASVPVSFVSAPGKKEAKAANITVRLEDAVGCPRYAGAVIKGVKIGPSPEWLSQRIVSAGGRSINNVVDVTNYMLLGFGQPMHAFDAARLQGNTIIIRRASANEPIRTLDGADRKLSRDMVVIADEAKVQAIAGVIGGSTSEVTDGTTEIFLEVAAFDPKLTRATRKALGVTTDASYRFERGIDTEAIPELLAYAVRLMIAVAGGTLSGKAIDIYPVAAKQEPVKLRMPRVATVLGETFAPADIRNDLKGLGFQVRAGTGTNALAVVPPSWRRDVIDEIDLIEEIARSRGYDSFSSELLPFRPSGVPDAPAYLLERKVRELLVGLGLLEVRPMPFVADGKGATVRVSNPLAEDEPFLRSSILDSLATLAEYNLARLQKNVRLFEIGTVFSAAGKGTSPALPVEAMHAGMVLLGQSEPSHFSQSGTRNFDEWDAKWVAQVVAEAAFGAADLRLNVISDGLWEIASGGKSVGRVSRLNLNVPVWAAPAFGIEIDLTPAIGLKSPATTYRSLPNTPPVEVDLALLVPAAATSEQIEEVIRKEAGDLLESVMLFDEFRGKGIPDGTRSLAWRLTFRSPERTLKDKEVQGRTAKIVRSLEEKLGVRQRTS
ncbi:MAG: phenylalanine--tRNA ligase subunit beta [Gemmatimonadaceae bacterium]|nr:phenylalanine--tRNA ligase subunit beta [Gemmatimonadaceae bacterium]